MSGDFGLRSPSFAGGARIPKRHAYPPEGEDISPALEWSGVPAGTKELVLIVEDPVPQAKTIVHWVVYGIPPTATGIPEGVPKNAPRSHGFAQGTNDFGQLGWSGPGPHVGEPTHKYWFWLYAIDKHLTLEPGATKKAVMDALASGGRHILSNGRLLGTY